ncbi:helix-turn-helix transcriptional regulator [Sphingopyxis sp. BSN-002]|uniref:helix-turn-helix domain-containing protein n=1 Tax=Sphingopyxis sp. BSN-002 TaxID=2911495 RepID=UPI001EDAA7DC|nr:helix-turn-helix transcriptional regulator [Sphingopyxis sp. BSN-002]UKK85770.1 helix-turn-helix transcriptional regulator [Sphingopyxis sp. BSN-002]
MKQNFPLPSEAASMAARLSDRQRECLILVKDGLTSKEIGRLLSLSPSTIDNHLNAAAERLGCSSRIVAARILETAEQFAERGDLHSQSEDNKAKFTHPDDLRLGSKAARNLLPPLGGATNDEPLIQRILHIGLIAIAATMAFAAITITIAGVVDLFSR